MAKGVKPWPPTPRMPEPAGTGWRYSSAFGFTCQRDSTTGPYVVRDPAGEIVARSDTALVAIGWMLVQRPKDQGGTP